MDFKNIVNVFSSGNKPEIIVYSIMGFSLLVLVLSIIVSFYNEIKSGKGGENNGGKL